MVPIFATLLVLAGALGCSSPPGRATTPDTASSEEAPLLARLPPDAFLVLRLDHRAVLLSPYRDDVFGDENLIVRVAIETHFPREIELDVPRSVVDRASETVHVITMDDVGLSDAFTWIAGDFAEGTIDSILRSVAARPTVTMRGQARVVDPATGDAVAMELPGRGIAIGPRDRLEDVHRFLEEAERSEVDPTLRELASRPAPERSALSLFIASTPPVHAYLTETLARENVAGGAIDTMRGLAAHLRLADGARLEAVVVSTTEEGAAESARFFTDTIASAAESPVVQMIGLGGLLERARIAPSGTEATLRVEASAEETRALLDRLRALLLAYLSSDEAEVVDEAPVEEPPPP